MAILLVLLILTLGYAYVESVSYEKIKLRRSTGWESYVYLAKHGLTFLISSISKSLVALVLVLAAFFLAKYILARYSITISIDNLYKVFIETNLLEINIFTCCLIIFIAIATAHECYAKILNKTKNVDDYLDKLRKEDSVLSIIIEALINNKTVKVSLKSKKVYVGLVQTEQFESVDLDNIVIIPFLSGYRDDNLRIVFDCDYIAVYKKNNILPVGHITEQDMKNLDSFRLAIKMEEVESISLFSAQYYEQFEFRKKGFLVRLRNIF